MSPERIVLRKKLLVNMPDQMKSEVAGVACKLGMTSSEFIREAIRNHLLVTKERFGLGLPSSMQV